ncbi:Nuclease [Polaribacter huanghezhanensis]|uniref:DNA/RNA non-specific endonuclease n=1 Tax=Polaribacter huanghezhanensis TaxID=1354726 RepID=UPI002647E9C5|nr:DNA/RNA non-specific endonuclease [Polaribacter huanghezhanensis]WKD86291.1 Nuclease [Polaribacter huanghezhanensis]
MVKRILLFLLIFLISTIGYYFFSGTETANNSSLEQEPKSRDSIVHVTPIYVNFLLPASTKNQQVNHLKYSFSYSEKDEQAEWVAYKLFKNSVNNSIKRRNKFREDVKVTTGSATLNDYRNSGYDRGHLAPAKAMSFNDITMSESFFMSNMSPQKPSFNRGIWKKLEEKVRSWILISDSLYVVTGPALENPLGKIGENQVTVPRYYYKSIIRFNEDKLFGIGFLLKNEKSNNDVVTFSVSIDSIEKVTGLDFFHQLDNTIQNQLESNSNYQLFLQK